MYEKTFEYIGLSPNEARIYESLIEQGESTISEIAVGSKIHRRNAYDAVERLIDKGLCFLIFSQKGNKYNAVDPEKVLELITEKREQYENILPQLKKKFQERLAPEEVYMYRGLEGQKNIWRDIIRVGEDVYHIGAKAQWYDPRLESNRVAFQKEAKKQKLEFHFLWDHEVKEQLPHIPKEYPVTMSYRYLPEEYSTNSSVNIFGDYVITYTGVAIGKMPENAVFFVTRSKDLAESYRTWFRYMWEQSSESKNNEDK